MSAVPDPARPDDAGTAPEIPAPGRSKLRALVKTARPKQWTKNVLVFAAPAAAGVLDQRDALIETLVAFVAFCLAASAPYLLNDAADYEVDRLHPVKRSRPIAAGLLSPTTARAIAIALVVVAAA